MFKSQMKFQKILSLVLLIFAAVCFVFSIGITTDLYSLYLCGGVDSSFASSAQIFKDIQTYNSTAVILSIVLIVVCLLPFIFATNRRRLYYLDNYITIGVQAGFFVFYAIYIMINSIIYKARFLSEVDFVKYKALCEELSLKYSESTFFFDAGIVLSVLCLIAAGLVAFNLVWKIRIMKEEKKILTLGEQHD